MTRTDALDIALAETRAAVKEAIRAGLLYYRTRGFVPWEIARRMGKNLTPSQMRMSAANLLELGEDDVAEELVKLANRIEREAEAPDDGEEE